MGSWHLAGPDGLRSAGAAFPDLFALLPGGGAAGGADAAARRARPSGPTGWWRTTARSSRSWSRRGARDRADRLIARRA